MRAAALRIVRHPAASRSRAAVWVERGLGLLFVGAGSIKLSGFPPMVALFVAMGGHSWPCYAVGVTEIAGALLLAQGGRAAQAGRLLLSVVMIGAAATEMLILHRPPVAPLLTVGAIWWAARAR